MTPPDVEPLRIGVLGASGIAPKALLAPARELGHRVVAVAARDLERARSYAARYGIERSVVSYAALVADPDVDVVYNSLVNGLHAPWNLRALAAGKHVLSEKPSAANAGEAREVADAVARTNLVFLEGFHYAFHPALQRVFEVVGGGELGQLRSIDVQTRIPGPPPQDSRWDLALAGGSLMDVGCYGLHVLRLLGRWAGGEPRIVSATAATRDGQPGVDEDLRAQLTYPNGARADLRCDMTSPSDVFTLTVTGSAGTVHIPNFVLPHQDPRLIRTIAGSRDTETLDGPSSFTAQLGAFASAVRSGTSLPFGAPDAYRQAELVDAAYRAAGLCPRPRHLRHEPQTTKSPASDQ